MAYVYQTFDKHGNPHPLWRYQYRDHLERKRTRTGTTSRRETEQMALQKQGDQHGIRNGVKAPPRPWDTARPISDLIDEYLLWGNTQGGRRGHAWGSEHARKREQHLSFWLNELKLKTQMDLLDIQPRVERVIHRLHVREGRSGKTVWEKVSSLAAFIRWCVDRQYLADDPLRRLKKINTDPVRLRRALTLDEIGRLLQHCLPDRQLLYETALCTGLRANELRSLTPVHLDKQRCGLRLEAAWTKDRLNRLQPIPEHLMTKLLARAEGLGESDALFGVQKTHPARMIQDDLKRAGIPLHLPGEGKIDFHSLRVTYCTLLDEGGASARETQQLARHSTPSITMNRYVKTREERIKGVVEALGAAVLRATPP